MKISKLLFLLIICCSVLFSGCTELQKITNLKNCEYTFNSITDVSLCGINVSDGISAIETVKILGIMSRNSFSSDSEMDFTLNLNVTNPNVTEASFYGMEYAVNIDGIDFAEGAASESFSVKSGETAVLPVQLKAQMSELLKPETRDAASAMMENFLGLGNKASTVKVQLKPVFNIAGQSVKSPVSFPVEFQFGGTK